MKLTVKPGPTSLRLFRFLKNQGALEKFVRNCNDINKLVTDQDGRAPDTYWNIRSGGFQWKHAPEGADYWKSLRDLAVENGVYVRRYKDD